MRQIGKHFFGLPVWRFVLLILLLGTLSFGGQWILSGKAQRALSPQIYIPLLYSDSPNIPVTHGAYALLGWNDLGMHCYNLDFQDIAVLPPYNTLWAQVIKRGDPPQIVTQGISVSYSFPDNTISSTKTNFWDYANKLFGITLAKDVGLKGKKLADVMDINLTGTPHFIAEGIPLTEYTDKDLANRYPYQKAQMVAKDLATNQTLATLTVVAPVSTEMHCETCHASGKDPGGNQSRPTLNILALHDGEEGTNLLNNRPVLCASCHSSNALGLPGRAGLPSLSNAMHQKHAGRVPNSTDGCYSCHPGPSTKCMRDVMSQNVTSKLDPTRKMNCIDCHGTMDQVGQNTSPWLNEPRCDTCHTDPKYAQNNALYRFSTGHGGVACEACHDSTHAIATSREPNDAIKFIQLQGHAGTLSDCTVCHLTKPTSGGPHQ